MQAEAWVVILAGGKGTRLWPLSRRVYPKQFLPLGGEGRSLAQAAFQRAATLTETSERVVVVSAEETGELLRQHLPMLGANNLLLEPCGRSSAPAITWAALHIHNINPHAVMAVIPADHLYQEESDWRLALQAAFETANQRTEFVSVGLTPQESSTQYGYILLDESLPYVGNTPVFTAKKFIEKPNSEQATELIAGGNVLWNTGTFAVTTEVLLASLDRHNPDILKGVRRFIETKSPEDYSRLPEMAIDYAVLEKLDHFAVVHGNYNRIDLGSLNSLETILPRDEQKNASDGEFFGQNSSGNLVYSPGNLTVLLGVEGLAVIALEDVVLVCRKEKAAKIRKLVAELKETGREAWL